MGVLPYVDPNYFHNNDNQSKIYKLNKKSDVYSIGVLMWQISSGHQPFRQYYRADELSIAIKMGEREKVVDGTPNKYSDLYKVSGILISS
jgi:serine/threonine protein kinase